MLASMAEELIAARIQFQTVEARSSVRDRLRHERVDSKLGGRKPLRNCRRRDRPLSAGAQRLPFAA